MKFRSSIFLGLFFVVGAQAHLSGCAPAEPDGGTGGSAAGVGGSSIGTGGSGSGGAPTSSGGAGSGGLVGIGGTAPELTCGTGDGGAAQLPEASFATFQEVVTAIGCDSSDCHGIHADLVLKATPDEMYNNLLATVSDECGGLKVVAPNDPDASALVRLLKGPCGTLHQMPDGCVCDKVPYVNNCLPAEYVMAIEEWVRAGAPK